MEIKWHKFTDATKNRGANKVLIDLISNKAVSNGMALDLGCGAGVDSKYLAQNGFEVKAIDFNEESIKQTKSVCKNLSVNVVKSNITDFIIEKNMYSLIICWNVLPFLPKIEGEKIINDIQEGLLKRGYFIFALFGPDDDWSKKEKISFYNTSEIKKMLNKMKIIKIVEKKEKGLSVIGENKFWHKIQGVAYKE